ncbi:hypothetical protein ABPG74_020486 [Tetrahymena malaccensis]
MECQLEKKSLNSNTASLDHRQEPLIKRNKGPRIGDLLKKRKLRLLRKEEKTKIKADELVLKSALDQHNEQVSYEEDEEDEFDRGLHTKEECHLHEEKIKKISSLKEKANQCFSFEMYQEQYDLKYACKNKSYQSYCEKNIKTQNLNHQNEDSQQLFKKIKLFDSNAKKKIEKFDAKQKIIYEMCSSLVKEYLVEREDEEDSKFQVSNNSEESDHSNMDQEVYQQIIEDQYQQFEDANKRKKKTKRVLTYQEKHNELLKVASKYQQINFPNSKKAYKKNSLLSKQVFLQQQQQQSDNTTMPIHNSQINVGNNFTIHSNIQTLNPQLQQFQQQNQQQQNQQNHNTQYQPHYQQQDIIMHDQGPEYLLKKVKLLDGCNKYLDKISWEAPEDELDKMEKEFRQSQLKPDQTITQLNNSNKRTIIQDKKFEKVYHSLRKSIKWSERIFDENSQVFNKMLIELNIEQNLCKDDFNILNNYKIQLVTPINESNLIDKKKNEQILEFFMQENNFVMDKSQIRDISGFKSNQHGQQQAQINQFKTYHQQVLQQQNQAQHIQSQVKPVELRPNLGQTQQQQQQIVLGGQQNFLNYQQQFNQNQRINQDQQIEQVQGLPYNSDTANQFKFANQFKGVVSSQQLHQSQGHNMPSDQQNSQQQSGQNITKKNKGNLQSQSYNFHHYIKCFKNNQLSAGGISSSNNLIYQNSKFAGGKNEIIVIDSPKRTQQNNQQMINLQQESNQTCNGQTINTGQNQYDSSFFQNMQTSSINQQQTIQQQTQQQAQQIVINGQHKSQQGFNNTNLLEQGQNQNFKINQLPQSQQQNIQQQNMLPQNQLLQQQQQINQIQNQFPQLNQYPLLNQFNKVNYVSYNPYAITTQFLQAPISAANNSYNQFFTASLSNNNNNNNNNPSNQQIQTNSQHIQLQNQHQQQSQTWPFGQINIQNTAPQQQLSSSILQNNNQQQQAQQQTDQLQQQVNRQLQLLNTLNNQQNSQIYFQVNQNPQQQSQAQQQFNQNQQQNDQSLQQFTEQNQLINTIQNQQQQQVIKQSSPAQANEELNIDQYTQLLQNQQQNNQKYQQQYFNGIQSNINSNLALNNNINSNTTSTVNNIPIQNRSANTQIMQNQGQQNNYFLLLNQNCANNQINQVSQQQQQQQQNQPQSAHQNQLYLLMQQQQQSYPMLPIIAANQNTLDSTKMHQVVIQQGVLNSAATACVPNQNLLNNQFLINNQITQSQII